MIDQVAVAEGGVRSDRLALGPELNRFRRADAPERHAVVLSVERGGTVRIASDGTGDSELDSAAIRAVSLPNLLASDGASRFAESQYTVGESASTVCR